jgi:superfamily II DNA helicase RecQ
LNPTQPCPHRTLLICTTQKQRFDKLGFPTAVVNGNTWTRELFLDLQKLRYRVILAGPEMCLERTSFHDLLVQPAFNGNIRYIVVDEAHCIHRWGENFRPTYQRLGELRGYLLPSVPILATTATADEEALEVISGVLGLSSTATFHLNLGNNRDNVAYVIHRLKNSDTDLSQLVEIMQNLVCAFDKIPKILVFFSSIPSAMKARTKLKAALPTLSDRVDVLTSWRWETAKPRIMKNFREGTIKILCATECAAMGLDISDVDITISHGMPRSRPTSPSPISCA